ncbi:glycosyltransferase [Cryobacterium psychrophilum]|uniref:Glycosyltransferase n=1 Tax=Cryobacterium psychrophilum TaxID=41988 RepID=A0A4Y8KK36_9MICO|nr:glycosyltransferase [Cryobacterium psychrophilum]TDW30701.1 GT2 family glycosyltransferase [Cryobacterium psychrophilum]TFD76616.1 glycosyltransferase [Cryobacterium psychrophilum]
MSSSDILVVLPTLGDRLDSLRETLETVKHQRQEVALTLAVVAPLGAIEARAIAVEYGATVIDDPKTGISAAINCGLAARTNERYYAWIGDDDLFRPGGLKRLQAMLDNDASAVLSFGGCEYIDPTGKKLALSNAGALATFLLAWGPDLIPHPGTMIRLDALEAIGGFDVGLKYAMDLDAFLKLRKYGKFISTRVPVSAFRWHPDSLTVANRLNSSVESEAVKRRHLPAGLRPLSPIWNYPIRWASAFAARQVSAQA